MASIAGRIALTRCCKPGFTIQSVAIAVEATRVTLIQILLQSGREGRDMSPLKTLYCESTPALPRRLTALTPNHGQTLPQSA